VPDAGPDARIDAGPDAGIDAGPDGGDAGPSDAGIDAGVDAGQDSGTESSYPYGHGCSSQQDVTGQVVRTAVIGTDQMMHTYYSYVPASYDGGWAIPVVISLHGAGDNAKNFVNFWQTNADENGFMVLVPEGSAVLGPGFTWNISDIFVVLGAIDDINRCYRTDMHRHILHGFSAGGFIAYIDGLSQLDTQFSGLAISSSDLGTAEYYAVRRQLSPRIPAALALRLEHPGEHDSWHRGPEFPLRAVRSGFPRCAARRWAHRLLPPIRRRPHRDRGPRSAAMERPQGFGVSVTSAGGQKRRTVQMSFRAA
jgi:hypothetical protein